VLIVTGANIITIQHSCYATDWRSHVLTYYKQALLILEIKDEPLELFVSVFENGSSYG
jgi:hypothetical protein